MGIVSSLIQSKSDIPQLTTVDLAKEQQSAIAANQTALPGAENLASGINTFNYDQLQKMLGQIIPGLAGINQTASANIASELKGELPKDVQDQIMRSDAFKSLRGGFGGGGMSNALTARDLGLTSLDLTNKGLDSATKWLASARSTQMPGQFDVTSMFISPMQSYQTKNEQNVQQFQRQMAVNQNDANFSWGNRLGPLADAGFSAAMMAVGGLAGGGMGAMAGGLMGGGQQMATPEAQSWFLKPNG